MFKLFETKIRENYAAAFEKSLGDEVIDEEQEKDTELEE